MPPLTHGRVYNDFRSALIEETKILQVGDPQNEKSNLGAVVSEQHMIKILIRYELFSVSNFWISAFDHAAYLPYCHYRHSFIAKE